MLLSKNQNTKINFYGKPIAEYSVKSVDDQKKSAARKLIIYEAETKDITIFEHMSKNLNSLETVSPQNRIRNYLSHTIIIKRALDEALSLLKYNIKNPDSIAKHTPIYFAAADKQLCGIAITGIPKKSKNEEIVFSDRAKINDTELDWLTSWSIRPEQKIKGTGSILLSTVYDNLNSKPFQSLYIRSEHPKNTDAVKFYESMGCTQAGSPIPCDAKDRPLPITHTPGEKKYSELIIPMEINRTKAILKTREIAAKYEQKLLETNSINPEDIIDFTITNGKAIQSKDLLNPVRLIKKSILFLFLKLY